ncbi:MAG: amino acid permease [Candidatus Omnitrophica bacterium]|nr:amino acid permease [Candidatus Omnitrophota bacterium]MCF7876967.1 amino acid permease [Candidatus Omnitrophota bacterium]MCF7878682.1 amino acid permease [Candidatus Omnitrophota bacterium]MCF7893046.1 amino acid permease [Candidatus Omnitrophota bacterium]
MISSGLFILPGLAFAKAGPAVLLSYVIAGFLTIPTLLSMAELTTAMPKAGGDYFYIMRGFGPLFGTIAGFSSWFSLSLKGAFALIGMGAYLSIITDLPLSIVALLCCLFFVFLNLIGVREAGRFQVVLVLGILAALFAYIVWGMKSVEISKFKPFFSEGLGSVMATASFVFISYGGLNKVVALAEETRNPARNLPLGMILSILVVVTLYALVIFVAIGVSDIEGLKQDLTPISNSAGVFGGDIFKIIISVAAFFAFISTANAGIMTASRYPLSMSRDKILPASFQRVSARFKTPYVSIILTGAFMILAILFLKLELLVKVASSLLIILFIFANLTVILFRESKISSYRPKFRSSYYPYMQVFGVLSGGFLLIEMGSFTVFLTIAFIFLGFIWYKIYVQKRASQDSALIHVLERLVAKDRELNSEDLLVELKDIVFQRDDLVKDKFHHVIDKAQVLDLEEVLTVRVFFKKVSDVFAKETGLKSQKLFEKFIWREEASSTVIKEGLAIPHIFVEKKDIFKIILVRAKAGIVFPGDKVVHTAFVLIGSSGERVLHLKILAAIAQITQSPNFDKIWKEAKNGQELKSVVLLAERKREVR